MRQAAEQDALAAQAGRTRRAWLAMRRQDVAAPVVTIVRLAEMLLNDACERGPEQFAADLRKVQAAGQRLLSLFDELLDPSRPHPSEDELGRRVRHDLRTPLNQVIGYCDLWLEDAHEELLEGFITDLKEIRAEGQQCLALLDHLLQLSKDVSNPALEGAPLPEMVREIIDALPRQKAERPPVEPGMVLVVDDNEDNRDLLCRWIRHEGHQVAVAENGRHALEVIRSQRFDAVLLDVIMPELDGFRALEHIKRDDELRHLPVIMLSALDETDAVVRCIEGGAEDYLTKPFNPVLLRARLSACLEKKRLRDREQDFVEQIRKEKARSDELLHVILPAPVVHELKSTNTVRPRRYENVAVMFCDIVGFTPFCDGHPPEYVVQHLQELIENWEEIALRHQVEKIKTIGDAFMAAAGLLRKPDDLPVLHALRCGLEMIMATKALSIGWNLRVGIHCGPVVAGVIGRRQYLFDLWGDTVNTAARMESHGAPGHVVLSDPAWQSIAHRCKGQSLGIVPIKGKRDMEMVRFTRFDGPHQDRKSDLPAPVALLPHREGTIDD